MYATAVVQVKYDEEVSAPAILIELFELQTLHPNQKPRSSGFFLHTGRFPGAHHDDGALLSTWLGAQTRLLQSSNFSGGSIFALVQERDFMEGTIRWFQLTTFDVALLLFLFGAVVKKSSSTSKNTPKP